MQEGLRESPTSSVSVVDFGPFLDGSNKQGVAQEILDSFKSIGFVYLINHGIPQSEIDCMFQWVHHSSLSLHLYLMTYSQSDYLICLCKLNSWLRILTRHITEVQFNL